MKKMAGGDLALDLKVIYDDALLRFMNSTEKVKNIL